MNHLSTTAAVSKTVCQALAIFAFGIFSAPTWAADIQYQLGVNGLACPYCAYGIEKKLKALDGTDPASVVVRLNEGQILFVTSGVEQLSEGTVKTLINDAGFTLREMQSQIITNEGSNNATK